MRRSKFTDTLIIEILQAVEGGLPVAEVLWKHGISRVTFFTWKRKYGGATVAEVKRLKALDAWAYEHQVQLAFIRPGKPEENAYVESSHDKFRAE